MIEARLSAVASLLQDVHPTDLTFLSRRGESTVEGERDKGRGRIRDEGRRGRLFSRSRSAVMEGRGYLVD